MFWPMPAAMDEAPRISHKVSAKSLSSVSSSSSSSSASAITTLVQTSACLVATCNVFIHVYFGLIFGFIEATAEGPAEQALLYNASSWGFFFPSLIWERFSIVNLSKRSKHFKNTKHTQISGTSSPGAWEGRRGTHT